MKKYNRDREMLKVVKSLFEMFDILSDGLITGKVQYKIERVNNGKGKKIKVSKIPKTKEKSR